MKWTVIIPCYNEEDNIQPVYEAITEATRGVPEMDILFVDDGSTDGTLDLIRALRQEDRRVKFISFVTNYGHQKALMAGLRACEEGFAVTMDADLQHPPEFIPVFIREYDKGDVDIVLGRRKSRQRGFWKALCSRLFYSCFSLLTGIRVPPHTSDFRLVSRRAIDVICGIQDTEPFLRGVIAGLRLPTKIVDYDLKPRRGGRPSYTFMKSLRMAFDSLLRFSGLPVRLGLFVGSLGIVLSLGEAVHYLYLKLFTNLLVPGQAELMICLGLMGGVILINLSLLLKVVGQVRNIVTRDPAYIIAESETE